jgi:hypothetical protein
MWISHRPLKETPHGCVPCGAVNEGDQMKTPSREEPGRVVPDSGFKAEGERWFQQKPRHSPKWMTGSFELHPCYRVLALAGFNGVPRKSFLFHANTPRQPGAESNILAALWYLEYLATIRG